MFMTNLPKVLLVQNYYGKLLQSLYFDEQYILKLPHQKRREIKKIYVHNIPILWSYYKFQYRISMH